MPELKKTPVSQPARLNLPSIIKSKLKVCPGVMVPTSENTSFVSTSFWASNDPVPRLIKQPSRQISRSKKGKEDNDSKTTNVGFISREVTDTTSRSPFGVFDSSRRLAGNRSINHWRPILHYRCVRPNRQIGQDGDIDPPLIAPSQWF